MVRQSLTAFAFVALGIARDPGCGGVDDPDGGTNAPCTRDLDCGHGLVCSEGVCAEPGATKPRERDAAADSEASDAADGDG